MVSCACVQELAKTGQDNGGSIDVGPACASTDLHLSNLHTGLLQLLQTSFELASFVSHFTPLALQHAPADTCSWSAVVASVLGCSMHVAHAVQLFCTSRVRKRRYKLYKALPR